jgi:integrase
MAGSGLLSFRNRALIAFLLMTGVRDGRKLPRSNGRTLISRTARRRCMAAGGKLREVTIFGDVALQALQAWRAALPGRRYVFPAFDRRQQPGPDAPMDGQTVFRVVKRTEKLSGVRFSPHTMRRTLITEALYNGAPIADVQAQAGHANEATTLSYARPVNARERRSRFRLRYG